MGNWNNFPEEYCCSYIIDARYLLSHLLTHSPTHSLTHSLTHLVTLYLLKWEQSLLNYMMRYITPCHLLTTIILTRLMRINRWITPRITCMGIVMRCTIVLLQVIQRVRAHSLTHLLTHLLSHLITHSLTHSLTYSLTYSLTHLLAYSLT